tara:strand:+ start:499 stop:816 length:318 start_codon:yes stop_codon:yes gene_type:complete
MMATIAEIIPVAEIPEISLESTVEVLDEDKVLAEKYKKYQKQMAKAHVKYRENNRALINSISKAYYDRHKDEPEWKAKQCAKSKRAYDKRKAKEYLEKTMFVLEL